MKQYRMWMVLGLLMLVLGSAGLVMEYFSAPGQSTCASHDVAYVTRDNISYEEAQQIYNNASATLKSKRYDEALRQYARIKDAYRALRPMILIRQAEAHANLNEELRAQELLQIVMQECSDCPLKSLAQYQLGQSHVRARQPDQAKAAFQAVIQNASNTAVALGSHYYLGEMAADAKNHEAAANHWRHYLRGSVDGKFSSLAAKGLNRLPVAKTPEDHQLIGLAMFHEGSNKEAMEHLKKAPFGPVWVELGRASIRAGHASEGAQVLEKGLHMTGPPERAETAIKALMSIYPNNSQKKAKLQQILNTNPKTGGDFILWELRRLSSGAEATSFGQQLLNNYPTSNWAPETSWALIWPLYQNGQTGQFLQRADTHLTRYPHSNSAPRVMFWKAKIFLSQGKIETAHSVLKTLSERYPRQFYAFRAEQIMKGERNPWRTSPATPYPPESPGPQPEALARYFEDNEVRAVAAELIRVGNPDDLLLLAQAEFQGDPPVPIISVVHLQQGSYAQSIRIIRDYLDNFRRSGTVLKDDNLYKLLYPVVYADEIRRYAHINNLDPYLVQAVARQESYFNPMAVSSSNAMGLMQLLPSTAQGVAQWEKMSGFSTATLFNPDVNVKLGSRYLRYLHQKFNGNSMPAVGGYNGGPGAMERWIKASPHFNADADLFIESIPYTESRNYIKEVFSHYWNYRSLYQS